MRPSSTTSTTSTTSNISNDDAMAVFVWSLTVVVEAANNEAEIVTYLVAIGGRCQCYPHSKHPHP